MRLGFLPNLSVKHTSRAAIGQIYIPVVSTLLLVLIIGVVLGFRNSENLAAAYGLAVTTTFLLTSSLFIVYLRIVWEWPWYRVLLVTVPIVLLELAFFVSGLVKFFAGGWLPLVLAAALILTMLTWRRGREIVTGRRERLEGTLQELMKRLLSDEPTRVPGWAVYPHGGARTAPLALRLNTRVNHALHEHVLLVRVATADVPHIPERKRCGIDDIGPAPEGLVHITLTYGFLDRRGCAALAPGCAARGHGFAVRQRERHLLPLPDSPPTGSRKRNGDVASQVVCAHVARGLVSGRAVRASARADR